VFKRTLGLSAALLIFSTLPAPFAAVAQRATDKPEVVQFAPGRSEAVLKGVLTLPCRSAAVNCPAAKKGYALRARAGQTLAVKLGPQDGNVIINDILDARGKSLIPADADEDFWYGWTAKLPETGDYRIYVSTTETARRINKYTLSIRVQ
jgi:hypothetical protein